MKKQNSSTVQESGSSVPAPTGSEQADSRASLSDNRGVSGLVNLTPVASMVTSNVEESTAKDLSNGNSRKNPRPVKEQCRVEQLKKLCADHERDEEKHLDSLEDLIQGLRRFAKRYQNLQKFIKEGLEETEDEMKLALRSKKASKRACENLFEELERGQQKTSPQKKRQGSGDHPEAKRKEEKAGKHP